MCDWRTQLCKLVAAQGTELYPLLVFDVRAPSKKEWPAELAGCSTFDDFYAICDGGTLSLQYNWYSQSKLIQETKFWRDSLDDYFGDGQPVLLPGRHVVFAIDSAGTPVIWDSVEDSVSSFFCKGGTWEPFNLNLDSFLRCLFFDPIEVNAGGEADDLWIQALEQLNELA